ncbi:MAG: hypothetical protein KF774_03605 [Planctomyces sp.]|nr:hypothetical protein [Planctomyces sp.]
MALKLVLAATGLGALLAGCDSSAPAGKPGRGGGAPTELDESRERARVEADAVKMFDATYRWNNVDGVMDLTHSRLIGALGGEAEAREGFSSFLQEIRDSGLKVESVSLPSTPRFFSTPYRHFAIVPMRAVFQTADGRVRSDFFILGCRDRRTADWGYIEGARLDDEDLRDLFEDFPSEAPLPVCIQRPLEPIETVEDAPEN